MSNNIISMERWQRDHGEDDARFLACPQCDAEDWAVVCRFASGKPFIAGLVCVKCDPPNEIGVVNGMLE